MVAIDPLQAAALLARHVMPLKVIFLRDAGGFRWRYAAFFGGGGGKGGKYALGCDQVGGARSTGLSRGDGGGRAGHDGPPVAVVGR